MKLTIFCVINLAMLHSTLCAFPNFYTKFKQYPLNYTDDPGLPLILTPFIEQNKIQDALMASEVQFNGFKGKKSYSGYFTVDKTYYSNMFFWYFPSESDPKNDPVVLWLQGGPGASSLIGLFAENGPFSVKNQKGLRPRPFSWTNTHSVIYIDNPVGTGFSFTNKDGYSKNETVIGANLYEALRQFFILFSELRNNDFYVAGESYGGKYTPAIAYTIHKNNPSAQFKINLKGIAIGNGLTDPEHQLVHGPYLYQLGLIDFNSRQIIDSYEQKTVKYIQGKQFDKAFAMFDLILNGDTNNHSTIFKNLTGFDNYFNYLYDKDPLDDQIKLFTKYVQRADVRAALHVGNTTYSGGDEVENNLKDDIMQSVAPWVSELLSNYRVLIYNGQLDIICAYPLTVNYLQNLNFSAANEYKSAPRYQWYVDDELAGYVKEAGNLTEVLVRDSGHMVPADQPKWAFDLISRFTRNKPFHSEKKRG